MRVGKCTPKTRYIILDSVIGVPKQLEETEVERYLGIMTMLDLKPSSKKGSPER